MHAARMAHTTSVLADGRVLILGGFTDESQAAASAEAYDPRTGQFTLLSRLRALRHSHTATVLQDGRVLVVGGYGTGNQALTSAELFDPTTNRFTPTGSLGTPRAGHVATLLGDGTVLIAGGVGPDWTFLSSAERFDPRTGRFTPTGSMAFPRESHAAVRLADGRVLIAGGHAGRRQTLRLYTSAEIYDPARGTFRAAGDMQVRRHKHDAVMLADGRVLISGGSDERDSEGAYRSTELFDPRTERFSTGPLLQRARYKHNGSSVLLPSGDVILAGGATTVERFDHVRARFEPVTGADTLTGQFSSAALMRNGHVLITGGYGHNRGPQSSAWIVEP